MTTDTVGGVWTYALDLARALAPRDVQVALATMGDPVSPSQRHELSALSNVTLFESSFKLEWMENPWEDVKAAGRWLLDVEGRFRPDVVHLNGYAHGSLPFRAPTVAVAHSCCLSWWEAVKGEPAPPAWDTYRRAVREGLQGVDHVVGVTRYMLDAAAKHYGPFGRSSVIHNGRSPSAYRGRWPKDSVILTAGRLWDEAKNLAMLQRVAGKLRWPIYCAGEGRHPDGSGEVSTAGVVPLGRLDAGRMTDWYARAAIYCLPARYEPFGLSALEAGLSGCALVLGDIPSLREVWGDAALFVKPDDDEALHSVLKILINDAGLREQLADRARHRAIQYSPQRVADAYLSLYRQLARRQKAAERVIAEPAPAAAATAGVSAVHEA